MTHRAETERSGPERTLEGYRKDLSWARLVIGLLRYEAMASGSPSRLRT